MCVPFVVQEEPVRETGLDTGNTLWESTRVMDLVLPAIMCGTHEFKFCSSCNWATHRRRDGCKVILAHTLENGLVHSSLCCAMLFFFGGMAGNALLGRGAATSGQTIVMHRRVLS